MTAIRHTARRAFTAALLRAALAPVLLVLFVAAPPAPLAAQDEDQPAATMSREERIRQHEERVRRIIEERRKMRAARRSGEEVEVDLSEEDLRVAGMSREEFMEEGQEEAPEDPDNLPFGTMILLNKFRTPDSNKIELDTIVREGDRFVSEVRLQNEAAAPFDRVRIALDYDKRFIRPVRVFDDEIRPYADGEPVFEINQRDSVLIYDVSLEKPRYSKDLPVLKIVWEALVSTEFTGLDFVFASGDTETSTHTGVYYQGSNVLGDLRDPLDGALGGSILVLEPFDPNNEPDILQGKKEELRERYLSGVGATTPAGIRLVGPEEPPAVGEQFDVDVQLANPGGAVIDALSFFVTFDPDVLQVVDFDRGNWIKRGTNVHDGLFRLDYPFDFHKRNEADNVRGLINYAMSTGDALALPSGTFARIRFEAVQPAADTQIELVQTRQGAGNLTSLRVFGYEIMSTDPQLTTPVVVTQVMPERLNEDGETAVAAREEKPKAPDFLFDPEYVGTLFE